MRELLTQYGPIAVMWFDTPETISPAQSQELLDLIRQLQPDCIVNSRVGNRLGDYAVSEQKIPEVIGASDAQVERGLGVGFFPPTACQFEALLDDVTMAAFDFS